MERETNRHPYSKMASLKATFIRIMFYINTGPFVQVSQYFRSCIKVAIEVEVRFIESLSRMYAQIFIQDTWDLLD